MRDFTHSNGSVTIRGDDGDDDVLHAKAVIRIFSPTGNVMCACGAPLKTWTARMTDTCAAELMCDQCFRTLGTFALTVITYR